MAEFPLRGIAASEGIAIGPAFRFVPGDLTVPSRPAGDATSEWARFEAARRAGEAELKDLRERLARQVGDDEASIFDAHRLMLADPMLEEKIRQRIEGGMGVEQAVSESADDVGRMLESTRDELFAARAADVRDVGRRLVRLLLGRPPDGLAGLTLPAVIVAEDLSPSDTAGLDPQMVLGIATAQGGWTSHSAILARTLGLPAVVALGEGLMQRVSAGDEVVLVGSEGLLLVGPEAETVAAYRRLEAEDRRRRETRRGRAAREARTTDGRRVEVAANVGDLASARAAVDNGADGVGLLRTEFLYLDEKDPPGEAKQIAAYREIFSSLGGRPIIIRTLDIGGDKPPSYLLFPREANPFLGWRAVRVSLDRPDLFRTQLRAILQASVGHEVRVMIPMVTGLEEVRRVRTMLAEAEAELAKEGRPHAGGLAMGIMVETPAAAVLVDILAEAADFFSLGTNDLTQYALAVDRGNASVAAVYQPLHPAVLRLIRTAIEAAHSAGKWIGMCGELAGLPKAVPILLGLGLDEFSMVPSQIPAIKDLISRLDGNAARALADEVLQLPTAGDVERHMESFLTELRAADG
jgi:phosphotransferase system enzyme I (PtsI)